MRQHICSKVIGGLRTSSKTWKLFCDTDGDRRPSPLTMLAYGLCPQAIVPLHLSKADLDRTETMLYMLNDFRVKGLVSTQVAFVVWNGVKSIKDEPCVHEGMPLSFTPTKVSLDILHACNERLVATAQDLPGLFVHDPEVDTFLQSSMVMLRQFADNVLKPSEELGQPFVDMASCLKLSGRKVLKFETAGGVAYEAKSVVIEAANDAFFQVDAKLEIVLPPAVAAH